MPFRRTHSCPKTSEGIVPERRRGTHALVLAGLTAAVLAISGCGADAAEPAAESASPSATKSATPSPTPTPTSTVVAGKSCVAAGKTETVKTAASPTPTPSSSASKSASAKPSASATPTKSASPTPTPSATAAAIVFVCTEDDNGKLVWMDKETSVTVLADRKAAADQKAADEEAAAAAEAQRIADEQAAAAEAQRLADEQARQQYVAPAPAPAPAPVVPAPAAPAPAPAAYYKNCTEARNAGGAPVYAGGPGYGTHLDRDGDGIGCEK
ncbi:excalibur calcium-binding domain-containing protein [Arthrobacter sp. zg-ZUI100]|uniref:excalibur calcium-binding domain-containing protein n=1 Tax=Arthrobacter jiangjiafuii TaxID=2817475 RepID=UPI001AED3C66|nr:excalibur calcium-binding domain-containing protein [Arthrobacter jiangjiafuii]MBP3037430.1 excalibur calcium-binding domain-containing protein [Arthrobacter jiangjiafuii]